MGERIAIPNCQGGKPSKARVRMIGDLMRGDAKKKRRDVKPLARFSKGTCPETGVACDTEIDRAIPRANGGPLNLTPHKIRGGVDRRV